MILAYQGVSGMPDSGQKSCAPSSNSVRETSLPHASFIAKMVSKSVRGSQVSTYRFLWVDNVNS